MKLTLCVKFGDQDAYFAFHLHSSSCILVQPQKQKRNQLMHKDDSIALRNRSPVHLENMYKDMVQTTILHQNSKYKETM
jgi:hypothetical protein